MLKDRIRSTFMGRDIFWSIIGAFYVTFLLAWIVLIFTPHQSSFGYFASVFWKSLLPVIVVYFIFSFKLWKLWKKREVIDTEEQVGQAKAKIALLREEMKKLLGERDSCEKSIAKYDEKISELKQKKEEFGSMILFGSSLNKDTRSSKRLKNSYSKDLKIIDARIEEAKDKATELGEAIWNYFQTES